MTLFVPKSNTSDTVRQDLFFIDDRPLPPDTFVQKTWTTNGMVNAVVKAGEKIVIGGNFTRIGPVTGGMVSFDISTGRPDLTFPGINDVNTVCSDGNGGWFVGFSVQ